MLFAGKNRFRWGHPNGAMDAAIRQVNRFGIFTGIARAQSVEALVSAFRHIADLLPIDLFVEAGAKEASESRRCAAGGAFAAVAFEANPHTYRRFVEAVTDTGVRYEHLALSDAIGSITFHVRKSASEKPIADGQGSLLVRPDNTPGYVEESVDAVTLDSY